jgi:alpha-beta hydrolase superfamily lysophospholipase
MTYDFATGRFARPENYVHAFYTSRRGAHIRYGYVEAKQERAVALHLGGQTQFLEMDYENARDLAAIGITTYFIERHGDGGSARYSNDPQKPPVLPHDIHVEDVLQFVKQEITVPRRKKLLLFGHCLGGLIALRTIQAADTLFDHAILTAPMFGTHFHPLGRDFRVSADQPITVATKDQYYGNARDWCWQAAQHWVEKDQTSHDPNRRALHYLWRKARADLRVGGYTLGNIIVNSQSLRDAALPEALCTVQTPVTVISADHDVVNITRNQSMVAAWLPHGRHVMIAGAWHGLWREADHWRNQLYGHIEGIANQVCETPLSRRQASAFAEKNLLWSFG